MNKNATSCIDTICTHQSPPHHLPTKLSTREDIVDVLKGIGILAVIAGHCDFPLLLGISPYAFHMPLFFFISGFFLNFKRGHLPFIENKVERLLVPYYKYWLVCALLCWLLHWTNVPFTHSFTLSNTFTFDNFLKWPFLHGHQFGFILPMWFVTTLFVVMVLISFTRKILTWSVLSRSHAIFSFVFFFLLCQLITSISTPWRVDSTIAYMCKIGLAWTFVCMGYISWRHRDFFLRDSFVLYGTVLFALLVWNYNPYYIMSWTELGEGCIKHFFPLISITGVYFTFFIANSVKTLHWLKKMLCYCGIKSFHIMAIHLLVFFVFNLVLTLLPQYHLQQVEGVFSRLNGVAPIWYFLFGTAFSLLLCQLYDRYVIK